MQPPVIGPRPEQLSEGLRLLGVKDAERLQRAVGVVQQVGIAGA